MYKRFGSRKSSADPQRKAELVEQSEEVSEVSVQPAKAVTEPPRPAAEVRPNLSVIGKTVVIEGEISANEDLLIQGQVRGTVSHVAGNLTIGAHGNVEADVEARSIIVQGTVRGDLRGEKSVTIEPSARVRGNISTPAINVKDGARLNGSIDVTSGNELAEAETQSHSGGPQAVPTAPAARVASASASGVIAPTAIESPGQELRAAES